jgi:hypothetical protein
MIHLEVNVYRLVLLLFLLSCGKTELEIPNTQQAVVVSGSSYNYVIVRLEFLRDIQALCNDLILESDYETNDLYRQAVAQCTFDKLSLLDVNKFVEFEESYCTSPQTAQEQEACSILGAS